MKRNKLRLEWELLGRKARKARKTHKVMGIDSTHKPPDCTAITTRAILHYLGMRKMVTIKAMHKATLKATVEARTVRIGVLKRDILKGAE